MRAYLSLGSNVGDRQANIEGALAALAASPGITLAGVSPLYETTPVGELNQDDFLNCAADIQTDLSPLELLKAAKEIESQLGRQSTYRWGPRLIDIDIILCDDLVLSTPELTLPHPHFRERKFVLAPLADIDPAAIDPVTGNTIAHLLTNPEAQGEVHRMGTINSASS